MLDLLSLPRDLIRMISLSLSARDTNALSLANTYLYDSLNEDYWRFRYLTEFDRPFPEPTNWKQAYWYVHEIWVCGFNEYAQFGLKDGQDRSEFVPIGAKARTIACGTSQMVFIDLYDNVNVVGYNNWKMISLNKKVKKIASGGYYVMFIDSEDQLWQFGGDPNGTMEFRVEKSNPVNLKNSAKEVACGEDYYAIIDYEDRVRIFYQFRPESYGRDSKFIACGVGHMGVIDMNDNLEMRGSNNNGQCGFGYAPGQKVKSVACGGSHTAFIDQEDEVWVMGRNDDGQLGLGRSRDVTHPTQLGMKAKAVACGLYHTLLLDLEDNVWVFGNNAYGQLGLGDKKARFTPTPLGRKSRAIACASFYSVLIS